LVKFPRVTARPVPEIDFVDCQRTGCELRIKHQLRERERKLRERVVKDTTVLEGGVIETKFAVWKVPRQCPLVLLVGVRLVYEIYLILFFLKNLERM
jgi:hypothetical protein